MVRWFIELHQATEHLYATLLLVLTNYRPKTHNLKSLHPLTIQYAKEVAAIFPQDTRFKRRYCEHYAITEEELNWLADQVTQLKQIVEQVCTEHIKALT